jgi:hypothetical protein
MAGAQSMGAGMAGAGRSIGRAIERYQEQKSAQEEERKRVASAAKASASLLKALNEDERSELGLPDPSAFAMLDPATQVSTMMGATQAFGAKKAISGLREQLAAKAREEDMTRRRAAFNSNLLQQLQPIGQPGPEALGQFYETGEDESQRPRRNAPPGVLMLEAAAQAGAVDPSRLDPDALLKAMGNGSGSLDLITAFNMARNPPAGFTAGSVSINPNGTPGLQFTPVVTPPAGPAEPILTTKGDPTGKAVFNGKVIDLQAPNSEGKTLTQSETSMLAAFNQAEEDLVNLSKMFEGLGPDWGGPVSGRVKSALGMGQNPNIAAIENAITAATPNLARGVFREVGVLTDEDIKRYKALLPTAYDTEAVRKVKLDQLRERIKQGRTETMQTLRKAGRDLTGFDEKDVGRRIGDVRKAVEGHGKSESNLPTAINRKTGQRLIFKEGQWLPIQ